MKIIISIIVILIIIVSIIIILNSNIYFSEDFSIKEESSFNQGNIEDLIPISYLPDNPYEKVKSILFPMKYNVIFGYLFFKFTNSLILILL